MLPIGQDPLVNEILRVFNSWLNKGLLIIIIIIIINFRTVCQKVMICGFKFFQDRMNSHI